jgi:L-ascorbate metabolism protein UlaG (beta-lactamase superfamily)
MSNQSLRITYVGGPTALLEFGGLRFLTDPTFDPAGSEYKIGPVTLCKTQGPALVPETLDFDFVLLSHNHHADNLDRLGRKSLSRALKVFTTESASCQLGCNSVGLNFWEWVELPTENGQPLRVTAAPGRHGPEGNDHGPVIGFILQPDASSPAVYISGDTVWFEGLREINQRYDVDRAILFMGAARVPELGPDHLTMSADDAIQFARVFSKAAIVPLHYEGWKHFSESRAQITTAFDRAGLAGRLHWPEPGCTLEI